MEKGWVKQEFVRFIHCHMKQGCQMSKYPTGYNTYTEMKCKNHIFFWILGSANGWDAEDMFAINEREYGVTVPMLQNFFLFVTDGWAK